MLDAVRPGPFCIDSISGSNQGTCQLRWQWISKTPLAEIFRNSCLRQNSRRTHATAVGEIGRLGVEVGKLETHHLL